MHPGKLGNYSIMKIFDYSYYRFCDFYKKKKDSSAEMTGAIIVALIQSFLIIDLLIILRVFWEYPIPDNLNKYWGIPIFMIILVFNWIKYVKPKKYREFRKYYRVESPNKRRQNGWKVVFFLTISIFIPIIYGFITQNLLGGKSFFR